MTPNLRRTGAVQRDTKRHLIGNFAQLNATFLNQIFLQLQARYDQSSTLPRPDQGKIYGKGFLYGSAGLGYEFTKTLGLEQSRVLNYGKI